MKQMAPEFKLLNENIRFLQNRKFCKKIEIVLLLIINMITMIIIKSKNQLRKSFFSYSKFQV